MLFKYCFTVQAKYSPAAYKAKFEEALDTLALNVPKLFVNLVAMFDVSPLTNFSTSVLCDLLQVYVSVVVPLPPTTGVRISICCRGRTNY